MGWFLNSFLNFTHITGVSGRILSHPQIPPNTLPSRAGNSVGQRMLASVRFRDFQHAPFQQNVSYIPMKCHMEEPLYWSIKSQLFDFEGWKFATYLNNVPFNYLFNSRPYCFRFRWRLKLVEVWRTFAMSWVKCHMNYKML